MIYTVITERSAPGLTGCIYGHVCFKPIYFTEKRGGVKFGAVQLVLIVQADQDKRVGNGAAITVVEGESMVVEVEAGFYWFCSVAVFFILTWNETFDLI